MSAHISYCFLNELVQVFVPLLNILDIIKRQWLLKSTEHFSYPRSAAAIFGILPNPQFCQYAQIWQITSAQAIFKILPYRNLNYKAQKFAMVLSSLNIHGINGSRRTLVFFRKQDRWHYSSVTVLELMLYMKSEGRLFKSQWGSTFTQLQCCFQANGTCWY